MLYGLVAATAKGAHERLQRERWARVLEQRAPAEVTASEAAEVIEVNVDRLLQVLQRSAPFELVPDVRFGRDALVRALRKP